MANPAIAGRLWMRYVSQFGGVWRRLLLRKLYSAGGSASTADLSAARPPGVSGPKGCSVATSLPSETRYRYPVSGSA